MFNNYERNPFDLVKKDEWSSIRNLLSNTSTCFPTFIVSLDNNTHSSDSTQEKQDIFPINQWNEQDIDILLRATLIKPTIYETGNNKFMPTCRLFHIDDVFSTNKKPTLICTDLPKNIENRVFPWADEAEILIKYIKNQDIQAPASLLNLFCGAGTLGVSLGRMWERTQVSFSDLNPRALKFVQFNHLVNMSEEPTDTNISIVQSDIFEQIDEKYDLIVAIPPFALQPSGEENIEHLHSTGGPSGTQVVTQMLENCSEYLETGGRLIFLSYSLGDAVEPTDLSAILDENLKDGKWNITKLTKEKVWRVGDKKRFSNPMPIQYMVSRLADPTYRANQLGSYERWEKWIEDDLISSQGFSHLHYVIVDYQID